jgi:hypothetical protein
MSEINNAARGTENPENCSGCGTSSESGLAGSIPAIGHTVKKEHLILLAGALFLGFLANILFFESELGVSRGRGC